MLLLPRELFNQFCELAVATVGNDGNNVELLAFIVGRREYDLEIVTDLVLPTQSATSYHVEDNG